MARAQRPAQPPPLTSEQVADLQAAIERGERPRVVTRVGSAAVPAGARGAVVRVGNPADPEFIVVRVKGDEIPFGPAELSMGGRARASVPVPERAPAEKTAAPRAGRRRPIRNPRTMPSLTVTFRFTAGAWTVEATRGGRKASRAQPARAAAVRAVAEAIDHEPVARLVRETVEACRSVVAERADTLRAELAAAEAALREYDG